MKPKKMTATHEVMACPVCHQTITARVTVQPHLNEPEVRNDGSVNVPVRAEMTRFNVIHNCLGRVEAEGATPS